MGTEAATSACAHTLKTGPDLPSSLLGLCGWIVLIFLHIFAHEVWQQLSGPDTGTVEDAIARGHVPGVVVEVLSLRFFCVFSAYLMNMDAAAPTWKNVCVCLLTWTLLKHSCLLWISLQPWSWILNLWTLWVCHWMYSIKRTRAEALTGPCGSMQTSSLVPTPRALCLPLMEPGEAATACNTNI